MNGSHFSIVQQSLMRLPYLKMLGFELIFEQDELTGHLPFAEHLIGNPLVPALHGGVIAALLHFTAAARLMLETEIAGPPRIFTATNEFLANPQLKASHASAKLITRTRRFANLRAIAWQDDRNFPIAAATLQFLIA